MKTAEIQSPRVKSNSTISTIYERRAVRKYKDIPVSDEILETILDAGRMAPSAMNRQPWKFYVVTNKDTIHSFSTAIAKAGVKQVFKGGPGKVLKTIAEMLHFSFGSGMLKGGDHVFYGAPVVVFVAAAKDNEWAGLDIGMCSQNMMLAAKSLGLDSCPVGFGKFIKDTKVYGRLGIPASDQVHLALIFGYGDENPEVHKRVTDNVFFVDPKQSSTGNGRARKDFS